MGLIYNEETAVRRDLKTQLDIETSFLNENNIVGRESDIQTNIFSHNKVNSGAGISDETYILTEDIILTEITASLTCEAVAGGNFAVFACYINGELIFNHSVFSSATEPQSQFLKCDIPNWNIKKGSIFLTETNGKAGSGGLSIVWKGYTLE